VKILRRIIVGILILVVGLLTAAALALSYTAPCPESQSFDGTDGMQAVVGRCYGGPEVLALETVAVPEPGAGDVLVRVRAAGVNPLDWHYMRGSPYIMRLQSGLGRPDDVRLGVDFSGVVEAVGENVTRFVPGDAVFGGANGAFAEYVIIAEDRAVAPKPDGIGFDEAAGVPIAALTALQAVRDKGRVGNGDRVLINGASGGVGTFAVQIAKSLGATVTGVSSARNHELVESLGADRMIDYRTDDYTQSGEKYDVIVDMVGNHSVSANKGVLAAEGRLVIVGGAKGNWIAPFVNPVRAMMASSDTGQSFHTLLASLNADDLRELGDMMADSRLRTVIDRRFDFDEIADAIAYSESGRARGKIIIRVAD